jgi:hypothetical protein
MFTRKAESTRARYAGRFRNGGEDVFIPHRPGGWRCKMRKLLILALCLGVWFGTGAPSVAIGAGHSGGGSHGGWGGGGHGGGWGGGGRGGWGGGGRGGWGGGPYHGGGWGRGYGGWGGGPYHGGGWGRGYGGWGGGWQAPYIVNSALNAGVAAYGINQGYAVGGGYPGYYGGYYMPYYPAYSPYYAPGYYSYPGGWPGSVGTVYDGYGY